MLAKKLIKTLVLPTPLGQLARALYRKVMWLRSPDRISALYDRQTISVMRRVLHDTSNCVDVGCFKGSILSHMLALAPNGQHYAFEPIPELARKLQLAFPTVHIYDVALSDSAGEATFQHVVTNPGYSGLRTRRYDRPHEEVRTIKVRTDTLDSILPPDLKIDLLKIDVEGAELQVLTGASRTLKRHQPFIVFEHGLGAADFYGTTPEAVYDLLAGQCGLRISLMSRWLKGRTCLTRDEFISQFCTGSNYYFLAHP